MQLDRPLLVFVLILTTGGWEIHAQNPQSFDPESTRALVRSIIQTETALFNKGPRFIYRQERPYKAALWTYDVVETDEAIIERLAAIDGRPLSREQEISENARLERLETDPQFRTKLIRDQEAENKRRLLMLRTLPDALLFNADPAGSTEQLIKIDFRPDPKFRPSSREAQAYRGMQGSLWIDQQHRRLVRVLGKLTKGVSFGWGILGHLNRGGTFAVEQANVVGDEWAITKMELHFTGSILLFKSLRIEYSEHSFDFRPVASKLSFIEGIAVLRNVRNELSSMPSTCHP